MLSLVDPGEGHVEATRAVAEYCREVLTVPNPSYHAGRVRKRLLQLASLGSWHSYEWLGHHEEMLRVSLEQMLTRRYDVVHFELAPMAGYAAGCGALDRPSRPVLCLDEHNIEYDLVRRTSHEAGPLRRAYSELEWRKVRKEERHAWCHLDGCTVTSVRDQQLLLSDEPTAHTAVVANGVDLEHFRPLTSRHTFPRDARPTLLFFGAIDYYPNTDAMLFFTHDVLPRLIARYPGLRLCIVGRKPPQSILAQRSDSVEITGVVEDVRSWIDRADVVIAPLRIGGGTRLKILEAMAMGKAVVSTTLGAEGLDVAAERDLLIADDAEGLAAQIGRLLDEPGLGQRLGTSARQVVAARYSWRAAVDALCTFYGDLLEMRAAAA